MEAIELTTESVSIKLKTFGELHPSVAKGYGNLAAMYCQDVSCKALILVHPEK